MSEEIKQDSLKNSPAPHQQGAGGIEYNFRDIEKKWQDWWKENKVYKVPNESPKPKYYVLDMFPYPSGAGLHVGHPLGYIASDIYARFKRLKGFNVLHPMGYDSFGLPAEQYAIEHGVHPAVSTEQNIKNFRSQLDKIGFSFDWDREVQTSDPKFYKWTQWIFLQLFNSFYNRQTNKAESIEVLIKSFEREGNSIHSSPGGNQRFTAGDWKRFDERTQQDILMQYRLAYCGYGEVNWCEALGTVLANDEVVNGVSERGGYPVVKKKLRQWYLRITEYADRLLEGLERIEFSESMKEMQTNWIGKSFGAEIVFPLSISPRRGEDKEETGAKTAAKDKVKMPGYGYAEYKAGSEMSFENAKQMRKEPTQAEKVLWSALQNKKLGYKFRRQHPVENYIADFACLDVWLLVEADGGYHSSAEQQKADRQREEDLRNIGFTILRFTNEEVLNNLEQVTKKIKDTCDELKASSSDKLSAAGQSLSPAGRGGGEGLRVYTTRPDTIFGVDFMVIAPEHELVEEIATEQQRQAVEEYIAYVKSRSERERMAEKKITGVFTGSYAINPFNGRNIPIWISEYVLAGYGTGAIMAVPCGDQRDFLFAKHFNIPITNIIGSHYNGEEANPTKEAILENSDFINRMLMKDAIEVVINKIEEMGIGVRKVNYKMRDAAFSRQRYWGEPFPIVWKDGIAYPLSENELPLLLPHMDEIKPGKDGDGPLSNLIEWIHSSPLGGGREGATMPGYAGSSWYFLRYMDPHNEKEFCSRKNSDYWGQVDLYIGGTEHAVGHLLYSRMWTKFLYDLGYIGHDEPYKKLVNQGMIQGSSRFIFEVILDNIGANFRGRVFVSKSHYYNLIQIGKNLLACIGYIKEKFPFLNFIVRESSKITLIRRHVNVSFVDGVELDIDKYKEYLQIDEDYFMLEENGKYLCDEEVEKMSKSKFNTVNPDDLVIKYGADTFRMYEMFLGPVEMSKPWDTKGIEGVHRFVKKLWRLFFDEVKGPIWTTTAPSLSERAGGEVTASELKVLHKTIKKIEEDTERFSFNTGVSTFMICVNELTDLKCHKKEILEQLLVLLAPYAPHVSEELWHQLGNKGSVLDATYPVFNAKHVAESSKEYPISVNGRVRTQLNISVDASQQDVEEMVLSNEVVKKWMEGKPHKKIIYVKNKMVNVVV